MRRIKKITVKYLSLCKRGANQLPVLYKSAPDADGNDGEVDMQTLVKASPDFAERGELLFVGYVPEHRDSQGDIADASVCKEMGYSFMREGAKINIRHGKDEVSKEKAYIAESFIIQKGDERFADFRDYSGKPVDVSNGWGGVIKIEDADLRRLFKEEGWNGVSLQGPAKLEEEHEPDTVRKALDLLRKHLNPDHGEYEMKPEELADVLKKNNEAMATLLKEALAPLAAKPAETPPVVVAKSDDGADAPKFVGDKLNKEHIRAHLEKVRAHELQKSVDFNDPKDLENYLTNLEKQGGSDDEAPASKRNGRSDQPTKDAPRTKGAPAELADFNLSKEEVAGWQHGENIAKYLNGDK